MIKKTVLILFFPAFFLFSCKTDFDINAEWKETMIVYGLLNKNEKIHYLKINKAFLGSGNAIIMAQNPDSGSYNNDLEVRVEEWKNNSQTNIYYADTTTIFNKETGGFYSPKQVLYKFSATPDVDATYKLFITNKKTGRIVSSQTELVHPFSISNPLTGMPVNFTATSNITVKWTSAYYGKLYEIVVRFTYLEVSNNYQDTLSKSLDWIIGTYKSEDISGGRIMTASYYGPAFFSFLREKIDDDANVNKRIVTNPLDPDGRPLQFIFSAAAEEFNTYMEVNTPSTGISQEKPQYTNINNGIGLFSSRLQKISGHTMNNSSRDSLLNGSYTKDLKFEFPVEK